MKHFLFLLIVTCIFISCKNQSSANPSSAGNNDTGSTKAGDTAAARPDTSAAAQSFFPVSDYIGGQIKHVDAFQLPLSKYITINHKTTPSSLSDAEFHRLASHFRQPDISDPSLKKFYTETSYADQSGPSIVFTYTTTNPALEIQKIDVIVTPDPEKTDKVKTIYMEKRLMSGDTIVHQKLYWRADHNFQIITEKQVGKTLLPAEQLKAVWDPSE